jgi:hypothetical protein
MPMKTKTKNLALTQGLFELEFLLYAGLGCAAVFLCNGKDMVCIGLLPLLTLANTFRKPNFKWSDLWADRGWIVFVAAGLILSVAVFESVTRPHPNAALGHALDFTMVAVVGAILRTARGHGQS